MGAHVAQEPAQAGLEGAAKDQDDFHAVVLLEESTPVAGPILNESVEDQPGWRLARTALSLPGAEAGREARALRQQRRTRLRTGAPAFRRLPAAAASQRQGPSLPAQRSAFTGRSGDGRDFRAARRRAGRHCPKLKAPRPCCGDRSQLPRPPLLPPTTEAHATLKVPSSAGAPAWRQLLAFMGCGAMISVG